LSNEREMYSLWINILKLKKDKKNFKEQELHFDDLARESKRWFEEDSELAARVANLKTRAKARAKTSRKTGSGKKKKKSQGRAPGTGSRSRKKNMF